MQSSEDDKIPPGHYSAKMVEFGKSEITWEITDGPDKGKRFCTANPYRRHAAKDRSQRTGLLKIDGNNAILQTFQNDRKGQ